MLYSLTSETGSPYWPIDNKHFHHGTHYKAAFHGSIQFSRALFNMLSLFDVGGGERFGLGGDERFKLKFPATIRADEAPTDDDKKNGMSG